METVPLLEELAGEIRGCPKCRLAETRTCAVPGEGSASARIMFVGEGPGEKEDLSGRPFVGAAGQFLNLLLQEAGIERRDVFITNIVKCRPPQNRVPLLDEVAACNDYLMAQIAIIQPKFICPLGGPSLNTLLGPHLRITKVRCQVFRKSGILYIPLFHPAAALHRQELQSTLRADILKLKELIHREIREDEIIDLSPRAKPTRECAPSTVSQKSASEVASDNLSLF
ncbi:MAG: uracil-DNA glycosylase [Abditibacteriota bacterium]|nr:uracil-DNA glycosylase [Abditibacteriota bacterium]